MKQNLNFLKRLEKTLSSFSIKFDFDIDVSVVSSLVWGFQTTIAQLVTSSPHQNVMPVSSGLALPTSQTRNSSNLTSLSLVTSWFVSSPDSTPSSVRPQGNVTSTFCLFQSVQYIHFNDTTTVPVVRRDHLLIISYGVEF